MTVLARGQYTIKRVANKSNLLNWQETWKEGSLPSGWSLNGSTSENSIVLGDNPFGNKSLLWKCTPDNGGETAGGFSTPYCTLDNEHTYRYTAFVYREKAVNGSIFHGCYNVDNLSGGANINPYSISGRPLPAKEWYLLVGYIHPSKADTTWQLNTAGVFDMSGKKIYGGIDFKLRTPVIPVLIRDYQYYTSNPDDIAYFYNPRLEVCDGNELSIEQLLRLSTRSEIDGVKTVYDSEFNLLKAQMSSKVESSTFNTLGARVGAAETNIQQQAAEIKLKAEKSEVTALGTRMSNAEQKITADAINMVVKSQTETIAQGKVDGLQIGGGNLLLNSKVTKSDTSYKVGNWTTNRDLIAGEILTVTIKGNIVGSKLFGIWFNSSALGGYPLTKISEGLYSTTFIVPTGVTMRIIGIYLIYNITAGDQWSFEWIKLESGNKATDWTPAPEDVAADAQAKADAARIAAEAVAASKAELAKTTAQAYADGIVTAEEQRAINDAQAKLNEAKADAALKYTTKTEYSAQIQILNNEISQRVTKSIFDTAISDAQLLAKAMSRGLMLYDDPTFKKGFNSVNIYINNGGGNVSITREKTDDAPNDSGYCLKINVFDGDNLRLGGFYFGTQTKANRTMVCRFVAKIPEGQILLFASNAFGIGTTSKWLTPYVGTGKWEEYAYYVKCGETGTFSSTFFFYLKRLDNQTYPITWYLAYATVFDLNANEVFTTKTEYDAKMTILDNSIASKVSQANFDSLGNRVGTAESTITQHTSQIATKVSQSTFDALGNRVTAAESSITQMPNKIALAVSTSEEKIKTSLTLDSTGISLLGKKIALTGVVTFSALASDAQSKVNTAQSTANTAVTKADAAQGTANTANSGLNTLKSSLKDLAYQDKVSLAKLDETIVEGGYLKTNLIDANAIITSSLIAEKIAATDITTGRLTVTDGAKIGNMSIVGGVLTGSSVNLTDGAVLGGLKATGSTGRGAYSSLTNEGFNNEAAVILRNDNNNIFCAIGTNVMPSVGGGKAVARFENEYSTRFTNFGLLVSAKNGQSGNIAIEIDGGCVSGFKYRVQRLSGSGTIETGVGFVQMGDTNYDPNVYLPSNPELGTIIYTCNANRAINVYGNGRRIKQASDIRDYVHMTDTNRVTMFVYTGVYWICNWLSR